MLTVAEWFPLKTIGVFKCVLYWLTAAPLSRLYLFLTELYGLPKQTLARPVS